MKTIKNFEQKALRIFNKNGGDGKNTKSFKSFSLPNREHILANSNLETDENPLVVGLKENNIFFMLTTNGYIQIRPVKRQPHKRKQRAANRNKQCCFDKQNDSI